METYRHIALASNLSTLVTRLLNLDLGWIDVNCSSHDRITIGIDRLRHESSWSTSWLNWGI